MERTAHFKIGATAAAFLLMGTFAVAQSASRARTVKPREGSSGQASGIQQRKSGAIVHSDYSRSADHAAANSNASSSASSNGSNDAKTGENPLYEESGKSGTNPMYEPKDRLKADTGASNSQSAAPYKDGEDMTTRTRPGVGLPRDAHPGRLKSPNVAGPETDADASKKHVAGVKYEDRTAAGKHSNKPSGAEHFKQDFGQVQATKK